MIKFSMMDKHGKPLLGVGLSHGNIAKLLKGEPIHFHTADINAMMGDVEGATPLPEVGIFIFCGATEESLVADLQTVRPTVIHPEGPPA